MRGGRGGRSDDGGWTTVKRFGTGFMHNFALNGLNAVDLLQTLLINTIDVPFCGCSKERRRHRTEEMKDRIQERNDGLDRNFMNRAEDEATATAASSSSASAETQIL
jgi:hypothetical protein